MDLLVSKINSKQDRFVFRFTDLLVEAACALVVPCYQYTLIPFFP